MYLVPSKIHIRLLLQESFYLRLEAFFPTLLGMIRKASSKDAKRDKSGNIHFDTSAAIYH